MPLPFEDLGSIRPEVPGDRRAIYEVHRLAFGSDVEPRLVDMLGESGDAEISLTAESDGEVIGHVLFSRLQTPTRALALAPVAVLPARQGQGVGSALIRAGLHAAQLAGWGAVFVVGEPGYYRRFGFDVEAAKGFQCAYAGEYFMVLFLGSAHAMDGAVTYPPAFAELE